MPAAAAPPRETSRGIFEQPDVKSVSIQDYHPGGRIWIAQIYDRLNEQTLQNNLLSINSQRIIFNELSPDEGCVEIQDDIYEYIHFANYLLIVVFRLNYNLIRRYRAMKAITSLFKSIFASINPESLDNNFLNFILGLEEIICNGRFMPSITPAYKLIQMESKNEDNYLERVAFLQQSKDQNINRPESLINNGLKSSSKLIKSIMKGVNVPILQSAGLSDSKTSQMLKSLLDNLDKKSDVPKANYPLKKETVILNVAESKSGNDLSNKPAKAIASIVGTDNLNIDALKIKEKIVETPKFENKFKIHKKIVYKLDNELAAISSTKTSSIDLNFFNNCSETSCLSFSVENFEILSNMKLKINPKIKRLPDNEFRILLEPKKESSIKLIKWDEKDKNERLPFSVESWINNSGSTDLIEEVLYEFDFSKLPCQVKDFRMSLNLIEALDEPVIKSSPQGVLLYDSEYSQIIWEIESIDPSTDNQIIEFTSSGISKLSGSIVMKLMDDSTDTVNIKNVKIAESERVEDFKELNIPVNRINYVEATF